MEQCLRNLETLNKYKFQKFVMKATEVNIRKYYLIILYYLIETLLLNTNVLQKVHVLFYFKKDGGGYLGITNDT